MNITNYILILYLSYKNVMCKIKYRSISCIENDKVYNRKTIYVILCLRA